MELGEYGMNTYLLRLVACLSLCVSLNSFGAITSYYQDFEGLTAASTNNSDLSNDGWRVTGFVYDDGYTPSTTFPDNFIYFYGALFPAPNNGGGGFSQVFSGNETIGNGNKHLWIYNDYDNRQAHDSGQFVRAVFLQEYIISEDDIGKTLTFNFDAKRPEALYNDLGGDSSIAAGNNCIKTCSAQAFIHTLDPSNSYLPSNRLVEVTTEISQNEWSSHTITLELTDPLLTSQLLWIGFESFATNDDNTLVYYDNISISTSAVPLPAGIYLFLSGLVGLGLMRGRNA
jgi:hypothetical protein